MSLTKVIGSLYGLPLYEYDGFSEHQCDLLFAVDVMGEPWDRFMNVDDGRTITGLTWHAVHTDEGEYVSEERSVTVMFEWDDEKNVQKAYELRVGLTRTCVDVHFDTHTNETCAEIYEWDGHLGSQAYKFFGSLPRMLYYVTRGCFDLGIDEWTEGSALEHIRRWETFETLRLKD